MQSCLSLNAEAERITRYENECYVEYALEKTACTRDQFRACPKSMAILGSKDPRKKLTSSFILKMGKLDFDEMLPFLKSEFPDIDAFVLECFYHSLLTRQQKDPLYFFPPKKVDILLGNCVPYIFRSQMKNK